MRVEPLGGACLPVGGNCAASALGGSGVQLIDEVAGVAPCRLEGRPLDDVVAGLPAVHAAAAVGQGPLVEGGEDRRVLAAVLRTEGVEHRVDGCRVVPGVLARPQLDRRQGGDHAVEEQGAHLGREVLRICPAHGGAIAHAPEGERFLAERLAQCIDIVHELPGADKVGCVAIGLQAGRGGLFLSLDILRDPGLPVDRSGRRCMRCLAVAAAHGGFGHADTARIPRDEVEPLAHGRGQQGIDPRDVAHALGAGAAGVEGDDADALRLAGGGDLRDRDRVGALDLGGAPVARDLERAASSRPRQRRIASGPGEWRWRVGNGCRRQRGGRRGRCGNRHLHRGTDVPLGHHREGRRGAQCEREKSRQRKQAAAPLGWSGEHPTMLSGLRSRRRLERACPRISLAGSTLAA